VLRRLAQIEGLHSRFDEANRLLGEAEALAGASNVARGQIRWAGITPSCCIGAKRSTT